MPRLLYNVPVNGNKDYMQDQGRSSFLTDRLGDATLVSSLTSEGRHAPALDIDVPAVLVRTEAGLTLWLDLPTRFRHFKRLLGELERAGIARSGVLLRRRADRKRMFETERFAALDVSNIWDSMVKLSNGFVGTFEDLLAVGRSVSSDPEIVVAKRMRNPWPVLLNPDVDVFLAPSSTKDHSHLYVESSFLWPQYLTILERLVEASVLEPGYLGASLSRKATNLRRPGYFKGSPD